MSLFPMYSTAQAAVVTMAFTDSSVSESNLTDYSGQFDSQAIGTAASDRLVVIAVGGARSSSGSRTVSTCTIGGVTATRVLNGTSVNGDLNAIWAATVPTGTTADIDIATGAGMNSLGIGVWVLYGANSTATDTGADNLPSAGATVFSDTLVIPTGGVGIGYCLNVCDGTPTTVWTNLTEDFDELIEGTNQPAHCGASSTTEGSLVRTATTAATGSSCITLAAFGPA